MLAKNSVPLILLCLLATQSTFVGYLVLKL